MNFIMFLPVVVCIFLQPLALAETTSSSGLDQEHHSTGAAKFNYYHFNKSNFADFESEKNVSVIAFGSCSKQSLRQPLWKYIIKQKPDLWIWLGDAVYADTRLVPFFWITAPLSEMQKRYNAQKQLEEYKKFLSSNIPIIGVWDDHDYGRNNGDKYFKYRLRSQDIFLDFLDEPLDSIRRTREGIYASYIMGNGNQKIKIILLDVRSNSEPYHPCDFLGKEQWQWLEKQLADDSAKVTIIGSGMQILSDIPFIEKWQTCPSSLDKLIWLTQKRDHVFFLSGDVHFSEVNCMNSSATGYPLYEMTSSSLTHACSSSLIPFGVCDWILKNVVASCYRISSVITEINFGVIRIKWNESPVQIAFEIHGENGMMTSTVVSLNDLQKRKIPKRCPAAVEQPNWYWKRIFWCSVVMLAVFAFILSIWLSIIVCRWFIKEVLKDLDVKIKNGFVKLSKKNKVKHD